MRKQTRNLLLYHEVEHILCKPGDSPRHNVAARPRFHRHWLVTNYVFDRHSHSMDHNRSLLLDNNYVSILARNRIAVENIFPRKSTNRITFPLIERWTKRFLTFFGGEWADLARFGEWWTGEFLGRSGGDGEPFFSGSIRWRTRWDNDRPVRCLDSYSIEWKCLARRKRKPTNSNLLYTRTSRSKIETILNKRLSSSVFLKNTKATISINRRTKENQSSDLLIGYMMW